jgi:hypothetical protein
MIITMLFTPLYYKSEYCNHIHGLRSVNFKKLLETTLWEIGKGKKSFFFYFLCNYCFSFFPMNVGVRSSAINC